MYVMNIIDSMSLVKDASSVNKILHKIVDLDCIDEEAINKSDPLLQINWWKSLNMIDAKVNYAKCFI